MEQAERAPSSGLRRSFLAEESQRYEGGPLVLP
jgi:hypothetical protein